MKILPVNKYESKEVVPYLEHSATFEGNPPHPSQTSYKKHL